MDFKILALPGDGIGPEIIVEAKKVLEKVGENFGHNFEFSEGLIGGCAIDKEGTPLPESTIELVGESDAVILGAVGGPKWDTTDADKVRPEQGLLGLRKAMKTFANVRPVKSYKELKNASTLKNEVIEGVDLVIVRELTGGIYFGEQKRGPEEASDTCEYKSDEVSRIIKFAVDIAEKRRKKVTSVDKANVLETSRLWRQKAEEILKSSNVEFDHMLVDNCAMQLIRDPKQFDVIVTENMFGDILSDEAAMLTGSIGMLSSGSFGEGKTALFEPIHGSAPDIAGQKIANPLGTISSYILMLRNSFDLEKETQAIENAINKVLEKGYRTLDIMENDKKQAKTDEMGDLVAQEI